jgi:uncharacterized membrane protein
VLAWGVFAAAAVLLAVRYPSLPARVPVHYDATGTPDRWGSPASIWWLLALWLGVQVLLSLLARAPHVHSYPVDVTEENAPRLYRASQEMLVHVSVATAVIFVGIVLDTLGSDAYLWCVPLGLVGMFGATVVGVARILRQS